MNDAFLRMSFFAEGLKGRPAGSIVEATDHALLRLEPTVGGHDLRVADVRAFLVAADARCAAEPGKCPSPMERVVGDKLASANGDKRVVLAVPMRVDATIAAPYMPYLSHEIWHAHYFLIDGFADVVARFWEDVVTPADKNGIRDALRPTYEIDDPSRHDLLLNEFQAYLLAHREGSDGFEPFAERYRSALLDALADQNIPTHPM